VASGSAKTAATEFRPGTGFPASVLLHRRIELVSGPLLQASRTFLAHQSISQLYPEFLITLHGIIRASVPLMEGALRRAWETADSDPVARSLTEYLARHIEEERGHDEWILGDLRVLGVSRDVVMERVPTPAIAALVGSHYYWIFHYHPVALLGYLAVSEGYPPLPRLVDDLRARTGFPSDAFKTLSEHADLDAHHGADLDQLIDSLPLTRDLQTLLGLSAMSTVGFMARCIEEVVDGAATASTPAPTND
jgi:hypothetical protein